MSDQEAYLLPGNEEASCRLMRPVSGKEKEQELDAGRIKHIIFLQL